MIRFLDGPAAHVVLERRLSPLFLRVVRDKCRLEWCALDLPGDEPKQNEEVVVYVKVGDDTVYEDGRWLTTVTYLCFYPQPDDETVRNKEAWQKWANERAGGRLG